MPPPPLTEGVSGEMCPFIIYKMTCPSFICLGDVPNVTYTAIRERERERESREIQRDRHRKRKRDRNREGHTDRHR